MVRGRRPHSKTRGLWEFLLTSGVVVYGWGYKPGDKGRVLLCKGLGCVHTPQIGKNEPQEGKNGAGEEVLVAQPLCDIYTAPERRLDPGM